MWFRWKQLWYWWTQRSGKNNFYRKSLILVLCITSLPTAIIGITSYIAGRAHIEREISQNHEALLKKSLERMNDNLAQLELAATQWSLDSRLDERLRSADLIYEYNLTHNLYRFLGVMKGAYPLINQVHLYLNQQQPIIVSDIEGIVPIPDDQQQEVFQPLLDKGNGLQWSDSLNKVNIRGGEPYVALVQKVPSIGHPYGALIFYLDKSKLVQMVEGMMTDDKGISFLIGKDGHIIVSGTVSTEGYQALETALKDNVMNRNEESGSYLFDWKGQSYSVSYGEFSRLGVPWRYVTATSLSEMTAPVVLMSRIMLGIGVFGLLIAVFLSWVASRRLYRPIKNLVNVMKDQRTTLNSHGDGLEFIESQWNHMRQESRALESKLEQAYPSLRAAFLMQLVQGHFYSLSETELCNRIESNGWKTESQRFVLLLVQIAGFSKGSGRFHETEEQLVTFAAANIAQEIVSARCDQAEVINFQDLTVGILLSYPMDSSKRQVKEELYILSDVLVRTISSLLKMQTAICIGRLTSRIKDIPQLLLFLRNAIRYRDLNEDHQVIDLDEMLPSSNEDVQYPFAIEKELIYAIRMGHREQSINLIETFVKELVRQTGKERMLQEGVMQVLGSIMHTMLETGFLPHSLFGGENLYEQLNQMREPERMIRFFRQKVILPYIEKLSQHQYINMKQLVEQVMNLMKQRFTSDTSLEEYADMFNTTPFTLSKAFKQINGMNFIDYLTSLRIEKAKELLRGTDMKVNEIAEHIGYQPSYFIRLFKKYENMTPGQFREKSLQ
ncbi:AraC-type DNA-binding protein [Paenibacillus sp. 1_12]|uniref:AraC family transcriptional regulator n=1 Tax=Paenibacillus sp. 1_12 TaxID=1566278 RepID=UPI0008E7F84C|nr:AraC family transcriptional regulator [Paenibacillus sp. 1_12]SFL99255.1 AraC-type DNA-binding protein [Paenibacillus sp. 1_12]